jgi:hypothetical protein
MVSETFKSPHYEGGGKASPQTALQEKGILVLSFLKITLNSSTGQTVRPTTAGSD